MLAKHQIRSVSNKGRYLFHNRLLHLLIGGSDWVLQLFRKPSREPLVLASPPQKILICCHAHIGDAILVTSVVPVLKAAFPDVQLGFLIHPGSREVFLDNPKITWLHTINHWKLNRQNMPLWKKLVLYHQSRTTALEEIKAITYDVAIDLYPYFPNSIALLLFTRIPVRLGWTSAGLGSLLTHALDWQDNLGHIVDWHKRLLAMLMPCQKFLSLARPEIHTSSDTQQQWLDIATKLDIPESYVIFHVGAGGAYKYWPIEYWKQLASFCVKAGRSIVLLGYGDEEQALCREITRSTQRNVYDLSGKLTWRLMTEAIGGCTLLVGLDSSSGHIAAARERPSVSIYTGITKSSIWRPFHPLSKVIVHAVPCSPCYISEGCEGMECVRLTTPNTVLYEITSIDNASDRYRRADG